MYKKHGNKDVKMNKVIDRILFSEEQLKNRVKEIGKEISADYKDKNPLLVGILKGSVIFMADLMRAIDIPCQIAFLSARSYGLKSTSSGKIDMDNDLTYALGTDIKGRHLILVEDILDTALTLSTVCKRIWELDPESVKVCALLDKKVQRTIDFHADYKCFDVENEFVVGYGLDYAQNYRNLPYIGVLKHEVYENK